MIVCKNCGVSYRDDRTECPFCKTPSSENIFLSNVTKDCSNKSDETPIEEYEATAEDVEPSPDDKVNYDYYCHNKNGGRHYIIKTCLDDSKTPAILALLASLAMFFWFWIGFFVYCLQRNRLSKMVISDSSQIILKAAKVIFAFNVIVRVICVCFALYIWFLF